MVPNVLKIYTKKNIDLNDFVLFCRVDRQLSKVTTKGYRQRIQRFLKTLNKGPAKITKNDLRQYLRSIQNNYIKWQYTYADTSRAFKIYFRDYLDKGDLVDSFRFPKIPFYPKRVPSNEEVKIFYKSIGDMQGRTMYLLFASSGLRRSELLSLHVGNIDVERNMVTPRVHTGSTKNSWCTFFNDECKDALLEYLKIKSHNRSKLFPWNSRKYGKVFWREVTLAFTVVCHGCGEILYEGMDMIPIYRLLSKHDGRCPNYNRKLSATPKTIELQQIIE